MSPVSHVTVTEAESGQKLLQFLQRRLPGLPQAALMRWIRKGEVRLDKKRAGPYQRVNQGQVVRIPPHHPAEQPPAPVAPTNPPDLDILHHENGILVIAKPAGLPVQPGSKHADSIATRLKAAFPDADFAPTPAHRLDKLTSGLVLAASTYTALRHLHELFKDKESGIRKEYLAWVAGRWPHLDALTLEDRLEKTGERGKRKVATGTGKNALAEAVPLVTTSERSLVKVRILTGRTHQIRVQLATRGFPILGDRKYGGPVVNEARDTMFLHAWSLTLPTGQTFTTPPPWPDAYMPDGV